MVGGQLLPFQQQPRSPHAAGDLQQHARQLAVAAPSLWPRLGVSLLDDDAALLGGSGEASCMPLQHLTALNSLDLGRCAPRSLPPQLEALPELKSLDLEANFDLGNVQSPAFRLWQHQARMKP